MMSPEESKHEEEYAEVGLYHAPECQRLFDLLTQRGVRFEFVPMDASLNITANGSSGWNFMIKVFVHPDDQKAFHQTHEELF